MRDVRIWVVNYTVGGLTYENGSTARVSAGAVPVSVLDDAFQRYIPDRLYGHVRDNRRLLTSIWHFTCARTFFRVYFSFMIIISRTFGPGNLTAWQLRLSSSARSRYRVIPGVYKSDRNGPFGIIDARAYVYKNARMSENEICRCH